VEEVPGLGFHAHDHAHGPDLCPFLCHLLQLITNDSVLHPRGKFSDDSEDKERQFLPIFYINSSKRNRMLIKLLHV